MPGSKSTVQSRLHLPQADVAAVAASVAIAVLLVAALLAYYCRKRRRAMNAGKKAAHARMPRLLIGSDSDVGASSFMHSPAMTGTACEQQSPSVSDVSVRPPVDNDSPVVFTAFIRRLSESMAALRIRVSDGFTYIRKGSSDGSSNGSDDGRGRRNLRVNVTPSPTNSMRDEEDVSPKYSTPPQGSVSLAEIPEGAHEPAPGEPIGGQMPGDISAAAVAVSPHSLPVGDIPTGSLAQNSGGLPRRVSIAIDMPTADEEDRDRRMSARVSRGENLAMITGIGRRSSAGDMEGVAARESIARRGGFTSPPRIAREFTPLPSVATSSQVVALGREAATSPPLSTLNRRVSEPEGELPSFDNPPPLVQRRFSSPTSHEHAHAWTDAAHEGAAAAGTGTDELPVAAGTGDVHEPTPTPFQPPTLHARPLLALWPFQVDEGAFPTDFIYGSR